MPTEPHRIYWDSCVFISCIERTAGRPPPRLRGTHCRRALLILASAPPTIMIANPTQSSGPS